MERGFIFILGLMFAASLYAAPTANEDYVDQQDAITYTNAVRDANAHADAAAAATLEAANARALDIVADATGGVRKVDGSARMLPAYLFAIDFEDSYPDDAAWYYAHESYQGGGHCSARRIGNLVERNFDWKFDGMAEVVVRMAAGPGRFASVGVANVGTHLTEDAITSGVHSRYFKCLPGNTVDGVNENGVVAEINVVDTLPVVWKTTGVIHPLAAVRWVLDNATNAQSAAEYLADNICFPDGWNQNYHYMIADKCSTWIVEDGHAVPTTGYAKFPTLTNFRVYSRGAYDPTRWYGEGQERFTLLADGEPITNAWWTAAYNRNTRPIRESDLGTNYESIWDRWDSKPKEDHRGEIVAGQTWWQTVHTSVYDISNRTLRVAVQERDDWYVFGLPGSSKAEADPVFEAARPYLCTIEAARQMTNGIPVVTKATVTGWGFLESFTEADPVFAAWLATDPLANVGRVQSVNGKTGAVSLGASDVGAFSAASGQQLAGSVQVLSAYIGGEDARAVITNYNEGASDIPHFYFEYKTREGTWLRVWDELTRWTRFLTPYELFTNGVNAAIARLDREKAPLAYGFYDTHTGGVAPDGFFSVSSEKIIIAKDMAYQKTITTSGEAWILEANEPMIIDGVTSNGFFKITDGDGKALFEIVKGDKRTVPATCGGVRTEEIMGVTHLHITYNVVSDGHPSIAICPDLSVHDWKDEADSSCCANVSWSGSSGAWVAEVWGKSPLPKIFVKGEYQVGGDTYIKNTAPVGFEKVVIGGITYRVTVETVSGKKLMVLTEAL